jgi:hypothetical protein
VRPRPPTPRIRKAIKWGGLAVALLCAAAWGITWRWKLGYARSPGPLVVLMEGAAGGGWREGPLLPAETGLFATARGEHAMAWWGFWYCDGAGWILSTPLWVPALLSAAAGAAAWRLDVRARRPGAPVVCPGCLYDRAGLAPSAPCPECAAPPPAPPA